MMRDDAIMKRLIAVLQERDIDIGRDDVEWAFKSLQTKDDCVSWVNEYLTDGTLLTKDELDQWTLQTSRGSTARKQQTRDSHTEETRPFLDTDLTTAIESLEASTAAIEKQCRVLETQKAALSALRKSATARNSDSERVIQSSLRTHSDEAARMNFEGDDLASLLKEGTYAARDQSKSTTASLPAAIDELLRRDDRLLSGLNDIGKKLTNPPGKEAPTYEQIDKWLRTLGTIRAATVRSRVDSVYLSEVNKAGRAVTNGSNGRELLTEKAALQEELNSLHGEIPAVVDMVVDGELRKGIFKQLDGARSKMQSSEDTWLEYVLSSLQYIADSLEVADGHAKETYAYACAIEQVTAFFESETMAPLARNMHSRTKSASARKSSLTVPGSLLKLASLLNISPEVLERADVGSIVAEHEQRAIDQEVSAERSIQHAVAVGLRKAEADEQCLLHALHAASEYNTVQMVDEAVEQGLKTLEHGIAEMAKGMGEINAQKDKEDLKREASFAGKWQVG